MIEIKSFIPLPNIRQHREDKGGMENKSYRLDKKMVTGAAGRGGDHYIVIRWISQDP